MAICLAAITALLALILTPHVVYRFEISPKIYAGENGLASQLDE